MSPHNDTSKTARDVARRCEKLGEKEVRKKVAAGFFTDEWRPHAERWLANLDHTREISSQSESVDIARSAKKAAWIAAIAAIIAAIAAISSVVISFSDSPPS